MNPVVLCVTVTVVACVIWFCNPMLVDRKGDSNNDIADVVRQITAG